MTIMIYIWNLMKRHRSEPVQIQSNTAFRVRLPALLLALVLGATAPVAQSVDADGNFTVLSMGTRACSRFVEAYAEGGWDKLVQSTWVGGYISAINEYLKYGKNISASMDADSRDRWVFDYCKKNHGATLGAASSALVQELLH